MKCGILTVHHHIRRRGARVAAVSLPAQVTLLSSQQISPPTRCSCAVNSKRRRNTHCPASLSSRFDRRSMHNPIAIPMQTPVSTCWMSVNLRIVALERWGWRLVDTRSLQSPRDAQQMPVRTRIVRFNLSFLVPWYERLQNRSEAPSTSAMITRMLDT
jgi:hypothetical protein